MTTIVIAGYAGDSARSVVSAFFQGFAGMFVLGLALFGIVALLGKLSRFRAAADEMAE